jgi:hypothetical protein
MKRRKFNWIGYSLFRQCLLKHITHGKTELTEDEEEVVSSYHVILMKNRRYQNLVEEALDRSLWRTRFGSGCGPVVKQTTEFL